MSTSNRIVGLDGLRAISIALVLVSHLAGTDGFSDHRAFDLGNLGVKVFFIISGYLITRLLRLEHAKSGTISLSQFYLRRTFRIFPAFYFYLAVVLALSLAGIVTLGNGDLLGAATYTMNYQPERAWEVGHLWSLAVEEQFYLLWPAALLLGGVKRGGIIALAVMAISPLVRVGTQTFFPEMGVSIGESFGTVADSLATGCALAFFADTLYKWSPYRWALEHRVLLVPAAALILVLNYTSGHIRFSYSVGETIMNLTIAFVIHAVVLCKDGPLFRALNARTVVWFGQLSYSLYLWQQLFLNRQSDHFSAAFPLNLGLAFAAAVLSFYVVEKPCLKLRRKMMDRKKTRLSNG